jgi:putative transposase
MAVEDRLWGQKRIQAELARLGFKVSARTVAKYMRTARHDRGPSVRWRTFLKLHASNIWACDFFCVQTLLFETLHVFFVIQHANREVLHVAITRHPTTEWLAQQILESCCLGSKTASIYDPRSRQPLWPELRSPIKASRH